MTRRVNRHELVECDVIGDVHGCYVELLKLLEKLGYVLEEGVISHPKGRKVVFLGDLCDRGPSNADVFDLVYTNWRAGRVEWVMGNHDNMLARWMMGNPVTIAHGLQGTITQLRERYTPEELEAFGVCMLKDLPHVLEVDGGSLLCVHAYPGETRECIYGLVNAERERVRWWEAWEGPEFVAFGHYWLNETKAHTFWACLDTSCVRGGALTALRWPSRVLVSVPSETGEPQPETSFLAP
jgi:protein phosphatase